jgi:hypothetical protein
MVSASNNQEICPYKIVKLRDSKVNDGRKGNYVLQFFFFLRLGQQHQTISPEGLRTNSYCTGEGQQQFKTICQP